MVSPATHSLQQLDASAQVDKQALENAKATLTGPFLPTAELSGEHRRYVALDCEMVGVGPGGQRNSLAQVVIVDYLGRVLLNRYVKPSEAVVDYRTHVSGITPHLLRGAVPLAVVQQEVVDLIKDKVVVGHGLENDMKALLLSHPSSRIRDTARFRPFCWSRGDGAWYPSKLKTLVLKHLALDIQKEGGAHEPAEDARGALALYKLFRRTWEHGIISDAKQVGKSKKTTLVHGNRASSLSKRKFIKAKKGGGK